VLSPACVRLRGEGRGAAPRAHPRRASGIAARPKSGRLRRAARIALYGVIGFIIGSIVVVVLYRALPPPGTPLMLVRLVEGYGIDKSWRPLDDISPHLIRAAMAGEDARFCRHHGFDWGAIATACVSRRRSPIRSTGRPDALAGACSPAALRSARTSKASPWNCPSPAGREESSRTPERVLLRRSRGVFAAGAAPT
jgi:hypothetical protein